MLEALLAISWVLVSALTATLLSHRHTISILKLNLKILRSSAAELRAEVLDLKANREPTRNNDFTSSVYDEHNKGE